MDISSASLVIKDDKVTAKMLLPNKESLAAIIKLMEMVAGHNPITISDLHIISRQETESLDSVPSTELILDFKVFNTSNVVPISSC